MKIYLLVSKGRALDEGFVALLVFIFAFVFVFFAFLRRGSEWLVVIPK